MSDPAVAWEQASEAGGTAFPPLTTSPPSRLSTAAAFVWAALTATALITVCYPLRLDRGEEDAPTAFLVGGMLAMADISHGRCGPSCGRPTPA
ncbi:hypothetical protein ABZT02_36705 [Streptomyces sp. NPDC005402]|uniref:hypothetical protein n=1 Tax=Streptomyces sp. NPDC005402 TaxID=3155338 RepID=UPI00339F14CB